MSPRQNIINGKVCQHDQTPGCSLAQLLDRASTRAAAKLGAALKALGPSDRSDLDVLTMQVGLVHHSVATGHQAFFKLRLNQLNYLRIWWAM